MRMNNLFFMRNSHLNGIQLTLTSMTIQIYGLPSSLMQILIFMLSVNNQNAINFQAQLVVMRNSKLLKTQMALIA
jgi:hypothetical protein